VKVSFRVRVEQYRVRTIAAKHTLRAVVPRSLPSCRRTSARAGALEESDRRGRGRFCLDLGDGIGGRRAAAQVSAGKHAQVDAEERSTRPARSSTNRKWQTRRAEMARLRHILGLEDAPNLKHLMREVDKGNIRRSSRTKARKDGMQKVEQRLARTRSLRG
jgi:hypothetical protein